MGMGIPVQVDPGGQYLRGGIPKAVARGGVAALETEEPWHGGERLQEHNTSAKKTKAKQHYGDNKEQELETEKHDRGAKKQEKTETKSRGS